MNVTITFAVEKLSGPFQSKEDVAESIMIEMNTTIDVNGSEYKVYDAQWEADFPAKPPRREAAP